MKNSPLGLFFVLIKMLRQQLVRETDLDHVSGKRFDPAHEQYKVLDEGDDIVRDAVQAEWKIKM